ncbi:MAG: hypothetical protein ETSY1_18975 [Candidatus Entotheonella factor]|uniref:PBP domain-containing protein n=1 Tax=Entotheonella factor TaxID=1429438 RepID=W4LM18_ENTF1|nr:TAXI family TRAP transporter solute-binding subunit [Candidatus Entotheonella palauensis]ETW98386.1 MAG: hypothetical protein ETSY1_18975 [Candidatus Entotheonella factor]
MARHSSLVFFCLLGLIVAANSLPASPASAQPSPLIRMGGSATNELTIQAAEAVCELMGRARKRYHFDCEVDEGKTPRDTLERLRTGELDVAVLGSDWQQSGGTSGLRMLFALDSQPLTILVRKNSVMKFGDTLKNRRIYIWNRMDHEKAFQDLEILFGENAFVKASTGEDDIPSPAQILCDQDENHEEQEVEAILLFVAHPSPLVRTALNQCAKLLPLSKGVIENLSRQHPYYRASTIPANAYKGTEEISTVAVGTTFLSWDRVALDKVYVVVSTVFENFRRFQFLYSPVNQFDLKQGEEQARITDEFRSAPWHLGAAEYFKQAGWESWWFYASIAFFDSDEDAKALAELLSHKYDDSKIAELSQHEPVVRRALNGDYAVLASHHPMKKAKARALLDTLRQLELGIQGQVLPTAQFIPKAYR